MTWSQAEPPPARRPLSGPAMHLSHHMQVTAGSRHTGRVEPEPGSLAEYFDGWYADMTGSPVKDEIQQRHLGLPPYVLSTSLLGWEGIAEAVTALRLPGGATLVDLACGRGGYGLEIA